MGKCVSNNPTKVTTQKLPDLLAKVMTEVKGRYNSQPDLLLQAWPNIVGPTFAPMTKAVRFEDGVLYVLVKNSTLLSLLSSPHDKQKLLDAIRKTFSGIVIRNIVLRIG